MQGHQKGSYKEGAIIAKAPSVLPVNSVVEHPVLTTEGTESTEVLNSYGLVPFGPVKGTTGYVLDDSCNQFEATQPCTLHPQPARHSSIPAAKGRPVATGAAGSRFTP